MSKNNKVHPGEPPGELELGSGRVEMLAKREASGPSAVVGKSIWETLREDYGLDENDETEKQVRAAGPKYWWSL